MSELEIFYGRDTELIRDAQAVRRAVFIEGQDVPEERELDGLDIEAEHYVGYIEGRGVAVARTRPVYLGTDSIGSHDLKIERVGVLEEFRSRNYGRKIMEFILDRAERQSLIRNAVLESQVHALPFYIDLGFTPYGCQFQDAGIPHKRMRKAIHTETIFKGQSFTKR